MISDVAELESRNYSPLYKYNLTSSRLLFCIHNNKITIQSDHINPVFEDRKHAVIKFLNHVYSTMTQLPITINICVELHDTSHEESPIWCFSKNNTHQLLIPDLYAMWGYSNRLSIKDTIPFNKKLTKAVFIGGSTGSYSPDTNERLRLCDKYRNNPNIHCYINNICQMTEETVKGVFPNYKDFIHAGMSMEDQHHYKYIISVDGNTSAWDRVPWILNSNSVLLLKESNSKCWYYPLLIPYIHYIPFNDSTDLEKIISSTEDRTEMIKNANKFVKDYLTIDKHVEYMQYLMYYCSLKHAQ